MCFKKMNVLFMLLACLLVLACTPKDGASKMTDKKSINDLELILKASKDVNENEESAVQLIDQSKQFAEKYPKDALSPEYLFKAADVARGLSKYKEAVGLWKQVYSKYKKTYAKAPEALFLTAFTYDKDLNDKKRAKEHYSMFLKEYPEHVLAKDVKLILNYNQDEKSDLQLIKEFEKKMKKEEAPLE